MMEDENIFLFAGFTESPNHFSGAIGVYDYFWALEPSLRVKLIQSWRKTIDVLEESHEELNVEMAGEEYGSVAIFSDGDIIEVKPPKDNIVPFIR